MNTHTEEGVRLMREAIDLPFMPDRSDWNAWCREWAARAEKWIAEADL